VVRTQGLAMKDFPSRAFCVTMLLLLLLVTSACTQPEPRIQDEWRCPPLPETFKEEDLVGTWRSDYIHGTETLTLREDGTYQQQVHFPDYEYSGAWEKWYLEERPSGGVHLHLEGMHYCLGTGSICRAGGGGGELYYDPCEGRSFRFTGNEVILAVHGTVGLELAGIRSAPRGIVLHQMRFHYESTDHFFVLQE
jgi:hypothetical protein